MADLKLNIKETTAPDAEAVKIETATEEVVEVTPPVRFKNRTPCNWIISSLGGDKIEAVNNNSGETFQGTVKKFNENMGR
jgi:hypothetical protein